MEKPAWPGTDWVKEDFSVKTANCKRVYLYALNIYAIWPSHCVLIILGEILPIVCAPYQV